MGCITAKAHRIGGIDASAHRVGGIKASAYWLGGISANASRLNGISASASRVGGIISASCSLVCTINGNLFLRVKPQEAQWIDIDTSAEYQVISNADWQLV